MACPCNRWVSVVSGGVRIIVVEFWGTQSLGVALFMESAWMVYVLQVLHVLRREHCQSSPRHLCVGPHPQPRTSAMLHVAGAMVSSLEEHYYFFTA